MNDTDTLRILVVEDTPGDVFLIKFYLEEMNPDLYEIQSVETLNEAHDKIKREAFDVILLDLNLPDSDGLATLRNTIKVFPNELIIVLTGLTDEKVGLEAVKNGAQDFLVKGRIDSKILDSSIKFAYERIKMRNAFRSFIDAIKHIERINDFDTFLFNTETYSIQSPKLKDEKGVVVTDVILTADDLLTYFNETEKLSEAIKNASSETSSDLLLTHNKDTHQVKLVRSNLFPNNVIITVYSAQ